MLVCAVLRARQDRGWASCPTRPRHASGPWRQRSCQPTPPRLRQFPGDGWITSGGGTTVRLRLVDPRHAWMRSVRARGREELKLCFRFRFRFRFCFLLLIFFFLSVAGGTAGMCQGSAGWAAQGRRRHGWRLRAYRGEGALPAKHCFASARTHSRQRLGRAPEGDLQRPLRSPTRPANPANPAGALRDQPKPATRGCVVG